MSVCNYTQLVTPNTCLGDSLATFNSNFSALDEGLCRQPDIIGGRGIHAELLVSEQMHNIVEVSTKNSFVYNTKFDSLAVATTGDLFVSDGTNIAVTTFPYVSTGSSPAPLATFSVVSPTDVPPTVSIFWTASGTNNSTIFVTNSATSSRSDIGTLGFNGPVTALLSSGDYMYVGGEFTALGDVNCRKFCILNLNGGTPHPLFPHTLGTAGSVIGTELSADGGFGLTGAVNAILETSELIIFGGTYQSLLVGRGLTIYHKPSKNVYPFYVNGDVNSLAIYGTDLYIGGTFDYLNYLAESASVISGLRKYTNGLAKISLSLVVNYPNSSISKTFGANIQNLFSNLTTVNAIAVKSGTIYIGGEFNVYDGSTLAASNLAILNGDGTISRSWSSIVLGEVFTLGIDGDYLYAGGIINGFYTISQFFGSPRKKDTAYNAIAFNVADPTSPVYQYNWKPKFNGPISKFAFHNSDTSTWVYCYGAFTQANGIAANYLAAVDKSFNNTRSGQAPVIWKNELERAPSKINNALIRSINSVVVGGSFTKINSIDRPYFARVNGVYETLSEELLKVSYWELGAHLCAPGSNLALNLSTFVSVSAFPGVFGTVNQTIFPQEFTANIFKNYSEGSLLRFFIRRPQVSGTLTSSSHIIGWKVDFN